MVGKNVFYLKLFQQLLKGMERRVMHHTNGGIKSAQFFIQPGQGLMDKGDPLVCIVGKLGKNIFIKYKEKEYRQSGLKRLIQSVMIV